MNIFRRTLLKAVAASSPFLVMLAAGMFRSEPGLAAERNRNAFEAKSLDAALKAIEADNASESADLQIVAQDTAENGALVPVFVISNIPNTTTLAILVEMNPFPLSAYVNFFNGTLPELSARLKFSQTSIVKAIAKADGKCYSAQREIKVMTSGCDD